MADKRLRVLAGSLRKPHFRYILGVDIHYFPNNTDRAAHFYDRFTEMCKAAQKKRYQEEFKWNNKVETIQDFSKKNSCKIKFLDGTEKEFDYTTIRWDHFLHWLYNQNEVIEHQRNVQGQDDEPEDDYAG